VKNPEFAAWVDARRRTSFRPDEVSHYRDGTLGAAIRVFLAAGYNMEFIAPRAAPSDIEYIQQARVGTHDSVVAATCARRFTTITCCPLNLEAMQLGIAAGRALKRPLFLESWGDYLDWQLDDIAAHFGFVRGPVDAWAWTTEAASG